MGEQRDTRYDYVTCASCCKAYQRIDFFGNPHAFLCANPVEADALDECDATWGESNFAEPQHLGGE